MSTQNASADSDTKKAMPAWGLSPSGVLTLYINGDSKTVTQDHPYYRDVLEALSDKDVELLHELLAEKDVTQKFLSKNFEKDENGTLKYKGENLTPAEQTYIENLVKAGAPVEPMEKFLEKVLENPSNRSREQLFAFLTRQGSETLPITEEGNVLMLKAVRDDYKDWHSGTIDNTPRSLDPTRTSIKMKRNKVSDDPRSACAAGLHAGHPQYVLGFHSGQGHILWVEVNPRDVVSVPFDANETKVRVCEYLPLSVAKSVEAKAGVRSATDTEKELSRYGAGLPSTFESKLDEDGYDDDDYDDEDEDEDDFDLDDDYDDDD